MSYEQRVRRAVLSRDGYMCVNCMTPVTTETAELHHMLFKSEYRGSDRNAAWNLATLCAECHRGKDGVHGSNATLRKELRALAISRHPDSNFPATTKKSKNSAYKKKYRRDLEKFKAKHNGMTPMQVRSARQKAWLIERNRTQD